MAEKRYVGEVFTPTSFPSLTYVVREDLHHDRLLAEWAKSSTQIASLSGPSKAGKTVLVQRVVGEGNLITVSGASVRDADQLWDRILDWYGEPHATMASTTATKTATKSTERGANLGLAGTQAIAKGVTANADAAGETTQATVQRRGLPQVIGELANTRYTILLDDFHYIPEEIQTAIARQLKDAASRGLRICVASVPHKSDIVVRALPELRGRVMSIDLSYWSKRHLLEIANKGFPLLKMSVDDETLQIIAREAAGSPQLMQLICLWTANQLKVTETLKQSKAFVVDAETRREIFYLSSCNTDARSLVRGLMSGPRARPDQRKTYDHKDGKKGDVYLSIMRAVAMDPPKLTIAYAELNDRLDQLCKKDESPDGASVIRAVGAMDLIAKQHAGGMTPVLEWDERDQLFLINDPYLLFYLRWSRMLEAAADED